MSASPPSPRWRPGFAASGGARVFSRHVSAPPFANSTPLLLNQRTAARVSFATTRRQLGFRKARGGLRDGLDESGFVLFDVKKADVKSAAGNPRVAGIALLAALLEHRHPHAALRQAQPRDEASEPAAYDGDITSTVCAHDRSLSG